MYLKKKNSVCFLGENMLVPYVTITKIALYESDEKFAEIRLFNKNNLKN